MTLKEIEQIRLIVFSSRPVLFILFSSVGVIENGTFNDHIHQEPMITHSPVLRGKKSLFIQSFMSIHYFVFTIQILTMALQARKVFWTFAKWAGPLFQNFRTFRGNAFQTGQRLVIIAQVFFEIQDGGRCCRRKQEKILCVFLEKKESFLSNDSWRRKKVLWRTYDCCRRSWSKRPLSNSRPLTLHVRICTHTSGSILEVNCCRMMTLFSENW